MVDVVVVVLVVEVVDVVVVLVVGAVVVASVESADSSTFAAVEATVDPQAVAKRATTRNRQARRVRDLVGRGRNRGGVSGCISTLETNSRGVLHRPRGAPPGKSFRPIRRSHLGFWT